jgi:hypothetical protein
MVVPLSAALEYLAAEILELSGNQCRDRHSSRVIIVADVKKCVRDDFELNRTFELFSYRCFKTFSGSCDLDPKTMLQSKAVVQFVFKMTESASLVDPCPSFLDTFLVEAACACASQTLSSIKAEHLISQLRSFCSGAALQSPSHRPHCSLILPVLELVSLCGSAAVVPFAADHHLMQLRLRLSSHVGTVCVISDTRR